MSPVTTVTADSPAVAPPGNATAPGGPTTIAGATTAATPSPESLVDRLPAAPGYEYQPWSNARLEEFLAGPFTPDELDVYVAEFAGLDVVREGQVIGWIELHLLRPEFQTVPNLDQVVFDTLSGYPYSPGPSTVERLSLGGEEILVRRTPTLVAWTWHEDGIVFNVVADGIDPGEAGEYVVALSAVQHGSPSPAPATTSN
jgi:hypothetical protein